MEFEKFEFIARAMLKCSQDQTEYLDQIPSDISGAIFDNGYVAPLDFALSEVIRVVLTPALHEELMWFLYDCPKDGGVITTKFEVQYNITDIESFLAYIKEDYFK